MYGATSIVSPPEAPVPIVRAVHRSEEPGGAANVAMNLTGLGAKASLFGFCGQAPTGILSKNVYGKRV